MEERKDACVKNERRDGKERWWKWTSNFLVDDAIYVRGLSEPVARALRPLSIRVADKAEPWKWQLCKRIKDPLPVHRQKGVVYSIECNDCDYVYVGETGQTLEDRCKKHERHTRLFAAEKSAVAGHALMSGYSINWKSAKVSDAAAGIVKRRIKEKLHIERLSRQKPLMNKDRGLKVDQISLNNV